MDCKYTISKYTIIVNTKIDHECMLFHLLTARYAALH